MDKYEFKKNGQTLELTNITGMEGLGFPAIDIASKTKGWRRDGSNLQWVAYGERIFSISFDVDNIAARRTVYSFFADKGECDFVATVGDKEYTLKNVRIAGDSGHDMPEGVLLPVVMQFMSGEPLFQIEHNINWTAVTDNKTITITNNGDLPGDLILEIKGTFNSLKVENLTTGETVEMAASVNNKTVTIDSKEWVIKIGDINGWQYCTENSEPPKLAKGENSVKITVTGQYQYRAIDYYASL